MHGSPTTSDGPLGKDRVFHILLVEDDAEISRLVAETLAENGFTISAVSSGIAMDRLLERQQVDLIVLDVMLPGESGLSISRRLRAQNLPVIMLTALGEDIDRIVGFEVGADDYMTKPFNSRELVARIRAVLRRVHMPYASAGDRLRPVTFAGWRLDPRGRELYNIEGARVTTTSTEFDLLLAFAQNHGRILSREQLLEMTHSGLAGPMDRSVDVHVSRLRQKIEPDPQAPSLIKTVRLGGYIFTPPVEPA